MRGSGFALIRKGYGLVDGTDGDQMSRVVIGGIVGGIILFVWMLFSWMVLPWHKMVFKGFENPTHVARVIEENAIGSGEYIYPYEDCATAKCDRELRERMKRGPFIYVQFHDEGVDHGNPSLYLISLCEGLIGSFFLCTLYRMMPCLMGYFRRVSFAGIVGFVIGVMAVVPSWTWMGASNIYTFTILANYLVGFIVIGILLAGFIRPKPVETC